MGCCCSIFLKDENNNEENNNDENNNDENNNDENNNILPIYIDKVEDKNIKEEMDRFVYDAICHGKKNKLQYSHIDFIINNNKKERTMESILRERKEFEYCS